MKNWNRLGIVLTLLAYTLTGTAAEENNSWPRKIEKDGATIIIYQPQVESLSAINMESRAAVSVSTREQSSPVFGAMWFDCQISTDMDDRTVNLLNMEVTAARFPDVDADKIQKLSDLLEEEVPLWEMELSLDQLLADLDMEEVQTELAEDLNNKAPDIIFTTSPSMLILVDGDPLFEELDKSNYERVLNTPYFIVRDSRKGNYYIKGGEQWYISDNFDIWEATDKVPRKLEEIADQAMGEEESETISEEGDESLVDDEVVPKLVLRTSPAELLQSNGEPEFEPVQGTSILFMSNTADDILMNIDTQEYYILVAGRWYSSKSLTDGPWSFVDPEMIPEGFYDIPADSDMGSVRSSVAGTQEAKEALLENQIPQTAEVDRSEAKLEVSYDGRPKFEKVGNTNMKYAINTDKSVLLIDQRYFCCDNAIWFESDSPNGPWMVSTEVPGSVQEIPPESPVYNVKYVYIYDSTPEVVYVGYTPGYVHSYSYRGCVYYGTGYYYRPWYGAYYYPRPVTYGYNVHWNPYTGWGFSFGASYGWMTYGWGSPYRGWWGPTGYRYGYHYGYHHAYSRGYRAGYYAGRRSSYGRPTPYSHRPRPTNNVYNNRAQGVRRTGNNTYDPRTGNRLATADRSRPATQAANRPNNVYSDRDGNVYRKDGNNWNRVENSSGVSRESRPTTGQQPSTRESRPTTGQQPSTRQTRPSTGQQPSTRESRPTTGQQPSTRQTRPSTGQQPSTRQTRPSTGQQPSTRQQPSQSNRSSNSYQRPGSSSTSNLNRDYNSRSQGAARSQQYQQSKPKYQQSRPSQSSSSRSVSPSRSGSSRSSSGARRR
jgi:hypothetical protein